MWPTSSRFWHLLAAVSFFLAGSVCSADSEPFFYRKLIADTRIWRNAVGYDQCVKDVKQFQCTYSPWKVLSLLERYEELMALLKTRHMSGNFRKLKNAIPCLMTRETGTLEPLTVSFKNCDPNVSQASDQGLGQVTFSTFCALLGLNQQEFESVSRGETLSVKRASELKTLTTLPLYNTLAFRQNPWLAFQAMSDNVDYAVDVSLAVLRAKLALTEETYHLTNAAGNAFTWEAQFFTIENYNGSDTKQKYAHAIMACKTCLNSNSEDPVHCLGLALDTPSLEDYLPCQN
jgi:hypothetical protein